MMLLDSGASVNIKAKNGKTPFSLCFENAMLDMVDLLGGSIDLNQDPSLFFAFGINILKSEVQQLLINCIKGKRLEDETINFVNDEGYTPFIYYVKLFTQNLDNIQ